MSTTDPVSSDAVHSAEKNDATGPENGPDKSPHASSSAPDELDPSEKTGEVLESENRSAESRNAGVPVSPEENGSTDASEQRFSHPESSLDEREAESVADESGNTDLAVSDTKEASVGLEPSGVSAESEVERSGVERSEVERSEVKTSGGSSESEEDRSGGSVESEAQSSGAEASFAVDTSSTQASDPVTSGKSPKTPGLPKISVDTQKSATVPEITTPRDQSKALPTPPTASPRRSHASGKIDNIAIFKKTFEIIAESKEAQKNARLKSATDKALESLANTASRDPHVIFEALKLACETSNNELKSQAVDLFAKLFDYASFENEQDRVDLTDAAVDVISSCFEGEGTDPELELQVVRALIHSIILMPTHGASLLKAVRQIYNVFIFSLVPRNQAVAQGTLTQVIGTIFQRVSDASNLKASLSTSSTNLVSTQGPMETKADENGEKTPEEGKITLEKLQNLNGDSADSARVTEANKASYTDEDLVVKDAFLIFRAMCKLSIKDLDTDNVDMRSHSVRSKLLSLHVIHTILRNNIDIFLSKNVVILSSNSDDQTRLIDAVRSYLCQSLIRNAASPLAPVFELTLETFWLLISNLRSDFKMEIPVLWEQIYFPVSEMKTSTAHQKRYLLSIIERLCNDSRCIIEFYLNYDCDSNQPNICEAIIDYLTRLSLSRVDATPAQKLAFQESKRSGISLYDISKIDNLTTITMSSKPPEPDVYNQFPLEYALKITSLNCSVAFLRSLHSWAQKGISTNSKTKRMASNSISEVSSQVHSRTPSFVKVFEGSEAETDDPGQFETQKQRKKAFLEGTRQFSQKPSRGIKFFQANGFIKSDKPEDIAAFLLETDSLDKAALGDYLGEGGERNVSIMHAFVDQMDFQNKSFVDALRLFLQSFRLPGEGQKIDRFMLKFAERYVLGNPKVFSNADTAYVLAYSAVMLNTDQHSKSVKVRMTVDNFIMNNAGIDDGKDIPREFLEQVFHEIQTNEIILQSEHHAALLAGEQDNVGASGFFGTRDWNREAYNHASKEMSTKTEKLVKNLGKKLKEDSNVYHAASNIYHVKSIFDTTWMSILAGLTAPFKQYDDNDVIKVCLEGIKLSIKISSLFGLQYAQTSFLGALVQFQNLNNIEDIQAKNVDAIYIMLEVAVSEGNNLHKSWIDILRSISQLERLQLIAKGIDQDSIPDVTIAKLVNRNSFESAMAAPSGFFSSFSRETTASQSASLKYHNQQLSATSASLLMKTELSVAIDKVFTNSSELSGDAIKDFVEALSQVASEEIESSGQSSNPRMFSLQKVVDICYYNMGRIRLEWSQLWVILGEIFNNVGCNPNLMVDFFALDSLRQLSMRFMDIEELSHFKFQKEFLKPFKHIISHNRSFEVKDMVLECINNMILAKSSQIRSGWKTIFEVLAVAAQEKKDSLVSNAYKLALHISKENGEEVDKQDAFADMVTCFTEFAKNDSFQRVGLSSLEVLSRLIVHAAKNIEQNGGEISTDKLDALNKVWFPILFGFHDIIMRGEELEVRSRTLTHFFDVLHKYGSHFDGDFWHLVYHKLLAPMFGILASPWKLQPSENIQVGGGAVDGDKLSFWVSTTLIQALNGVVSLFSHYFEALTPMLGEFLSLMTNCICQENDTIARTGKSCFQEFMALNCTKFNDEQWDLVSATTANLFDLTTAKELFDLDPLKKETVPKGDSDEKSSIVVKCVLQLLMIEMLSELSVREEFYEGIPEKQLMKLANSLHKSYQFAKKFNDDYEMRVRLWNAGVIERLPNLLKQESMSAAVYLNIMLRLYCDGEKATEPEIKQDIMDAIIPLCENILKSYSEFDEANQQKSISTWRPVVVEIYEGYIEMDEADFLKYSPTMYRISLKLFERGIGPDLRKALQYFMARIGDTFVHKTDT